MKIKNILIVFAMFFLFVMSTNLILADNDVFDDENHNNNSIYNASLVNATRYYGDGSQLTGITAAPTNSSAYWDELDSTNTTQFENQGGVLHIVESWLNTKINSLLLWTSITGRPTHLTNFTDNLGNRGYTSLSNFTNNQGFYNSSTIPSYVTSETDPLWTANKTNYYNKSEIIAFGYYNGSSFVITDYFTKTQIENFNYYNSTDFNIVDYFTKSQVLAFDYYNSSDFDITDYFTSTQILGFNYYNSTDFNIDDYYLNSNPNGYYNSTTLPVGSYDDTWINSTFYNRTESDDRYLQSYTETDPHWTSNKSNYYNKSDIEGFDYYNSSNLPPSTDTNETARFNNLTNLDCSGTNKVIGVNPNGSVVCGVDTDTTYTAGSNMTLSGTIFSINMTSLKNYFDLSYHPIWDFDYGDLINIPTSLSQFTDDLGNRGYTHLGNFTNNLGIGNYSAENSTLAHINDSVQFDNITLGEGDTTIDIYNAGSLNIFNSSYPLNITNSVNVTGDLCINGGNCLSNVNGGTDTNETSRFNNLTNIDCGAGNLVIGVQDNGTVLCAEDQVGSPGAGDIESVQGDNIYVYNGSTSGAVNLAFNTTKLNETINGSIDLRVGQSFLQTILDSTYHPLWDYDFVDLINVPNYTTNNTSGWTLNFTKIFSSDWSNVSITESQISDLGTYIESEDDPIFTAWDNFTGIPTATPSNGDVTHLSTADQIYDWVISLAYSALGASVDDTEMTAENFGEFTCTGNEDGCTLNNDALDDQYYDSESDLTGLLNDNYVDVGGDTMTGNLTIGNNFILNATEGAYIRHNGTGWVIRG